MDKQYLSGDRGHGFAAQSANTGHYAQLIHNANDIALIDERSKAFTEVFLLPAKVVYLRLVEVIYEILSQ